MSPEAEGVSAELPDDVELLDVEDLLPYTNNPKQHTEEQVERIASSIKNYGFDQPIVVDGEHEIIKGHGRHQAAKKLDLDRVPVIVRGELTDAEAKAARIADNKTHMDTGWDHDSLALELETLVEEGTEIDPDDVGFSEVEVESVLETNDFDVDEFFEEPGEDGEAEPEAEAEEEPEPDPNAVECPDCGCEFVPEDG